MFVGVYTIINLKSNIHAECVPTIIYIYFAFLELNSTVLLRYNNNYNSKYFLIL